LNNESRAQLTAIFRPLPQVNRTKRAKIHQRGSERSRRMTVLIAIAITMATGLFATRHIEIAKSSGKPLRDDEIYTGSILFVPNDGKICRQLLFDNRTGLINNNGFVDCEHAYYQSTNEVPMQWSAARARVIGESFRRR
jgi:hypothetical protein